jgi:nucleoside-diphosphate-sugar epimerase
VARTAFVTGATGFLGLNLVEALAQQGWRILALHRRGSNLRHLSRLPAERVEGDVTDAASLRRALPESVDCVFHVAGDTSLWARRNAAQDRVNIEGTRNVVEAALARHAHRLVHTSSISAFGIQTGRVDERTPQLGGRSWINYQRSKYAAEQEVRTGLARGLDAVIMNPAGIVGRYDTTGWAQVILRIHAGRIPGVPPGGGSYCHAGAVAQAHIAAAERGRRGENYLLGGADATFLEFVRTAGEMLGRPVPQRTTPAWVLGVMGRLGACRAFVTKREPRLTPEMAATVSRKIYADCTKAQRELDYAATDLRSMIGESAAWLASEGLLGADAKRRALGPQDRQ